MPAELTDDLAVDVLIIGGGVQGHYLARQLADRYSVCLLTDPTMRVETLEAEGYLSAGYDGNDANKIQPARRAAGYWKLWAESNEIPHDIVDTVYAVAPDDISLRTRLWSDAALGYTQSADLPQAFGGGTISEHMPFVTTNDVLISPSVMLNTLRKGIEHCCIEGKVMKIGLANDKAIEFVDVDVDGTTVPIVARYTVFAASGGNAGLLQKTAVRFRDVAKRKDRQELVKSSQAIRRRYVLCVRGDSLPPVAGHFGGFQVASHQVPGSRDRVWIVNPPIDDALTTLGPDALQFEVAVDSAVVSGVVRVLFGMSPELERIAHRVQWGVYARRKTEHPMMAVRNTSNVGQPAPAKIENFGLDTFMALWPSHTSYAMIVGDVAAERITESLGPRHDFGLAVSPAELAPSAPNPIVARWEADTFPWLGWDAFAREHGIS